MASMAHAVINGEAFTVELAKSRYRKVQSPLQSASVYRGPIADPLP